MTRLNHSKINHLFQILPTGGVLTVCWLKQHGVSEKLAWWYVHSGWLERIASGAYRVPGRTSSYLAGIAALQQQLKLPVYVGGKTALQLLGFAHYLPLALKQITLITQATMKLPRWLTESDRWGVTYTLFSMKLFDPVIDSDTLVKQTFNDVETILSCPERAFMEMLYHVPQRETFEEAYLLMQNLMQARSAAIQRLLEHCNSIKVKRLFLHLAERCQPNWLSQLKLETISLGHGKRVLATGGKYDPKYQISVPLLMSEQDEQIPEV